MALLLDTVRSGTAADLRGSNCLTIGLVNNMPDAAREATERQFIDLLRAVSHGVVICVKLFSIPDVPRSQEARREISGRYRDVAELWDTTLDGLIVTGTEPLAASLQDEPYWPDLARLVEWARANTSSAVFSCLAAHAAVQHLHSIERRPCEDKLYGVFDCAPATDHPLLAGVTAPLRVPHSRYNDLSEPVLRACGYRILTRSAVAGVDAFADDSDPSSLFVFFQGHPEYAADSLLREYRRDVGRFLRGERDQYPAPPQGYFGEMAANLAVAYEAHATALRDPALMADFPMSALQADIENTWAAGARGIYENWVNHLKDRKAERRPQVAFGQKTRRERSRQFAG
jgi:homoserine O-succinyltransferase/O-acetyltransferase